MRKDKDGGASAGFSGGRNAELGRPYHLAHQTVCITGIDFETESIVGYVELLIYPQTPGLKRVKINTKQCQIFRVAINESIDATYTYSDPSLVICNSKSKQRNLDYFETYHYNAVAAGDPDGCAGELTIKLPPEILPIVQEMRSFRICIEFSLENPKGGIKFVVPDMDGTMLDRGAHLFTYGHENSSRLWFPCIDSYSELCTWKLEFTVSMYMTAVSCGDLIETVYTADLRQKTYHYFLSTPTAAPNIALAVGPFEVFVDPHMHEVTHFCLPNLLSVLKHTIARMHEVFEFYEELLSVRYPYNCYKQVFVDMAYREVAPYATMSICSTNLLYHKSIIEQAPTTRQLLAHGVAQQFFGCFISMNSWYDAWLAKGLASYLCAAFCKSSFGINEYRYNVAKDMREVCEYEQTVGPVTLDPSKSPSGRDGAGVGGLYFPTRHPHTVSPSYADIYDKKSHLVIRMLDIRIGNKLMLQVLNKLLSLAGNSSQQKFLSNTWSNMLISTSSFLRCISSVTGKDVEAFLNQWVYQAGTARFIGSFVFNRKRNVVELELKPEWSARGGVKYAGPLNVAIQELDGTFNHQFMIEENKNKFEITCHSKSRRQKKKKIPLSTGEEVDMDLIDTDADSPVLWLRIDPDMTLIRSIKLEQPDFMFQYMLRYERCVVSQYEAIVALESFPTAKTRLALTDTIENDRCFYRIRIDGAFSLAKIANAMVNSWAGPPAMMTIFRKMFGSHSCPSIVRQNSFTNFQHYYIQKAIPQAMATLRNVHGCCPHEVLLFLLDLFKYNDNTKNKYADNYYRAALVDALSATVTPAVTTVCITGVGPSTDALTADTRMILEEVTGYMNLEKLMPSYRLTVTVSCLRAIRRLQRFGHLPSDPSLYKSYAVVGNFVDVRVAALAALIDFTTVEASAETLSWLLDFIEKDPDPYVRFRTVEMLIAHPPFTRRDMSHSLSTEALVDRLWSLINNSFAHDSRLRCALADLYFTLYGRSRPACLPVPDSLASLNMKDRKSLSSSAATRPVESFTQDSSMSAGLGFGRSDSYQMSDSPNVIIDVDPVSVPYLSDHRSPQYSDAGSPSYTFPSTLSLNAGPGDILLSNDSLIQSYIEGPNVVIEGESLMVPGMDEGGASGMGGVPRAEVEVTVHDNTSPLRLSEDDSSSDSDTFSSYQQRQQSQHHEPSGLFGAPPKIFSTLSSGTPSASVALASNTGGGAFMFGQPADSTLFPSSVPSLPGFESSSGPVDLFPAAQGTTLSPHDADQSQHSSSAYEYGEARLGQRAVKRKRQESGSGVSSGGGAVVVESVGYLSSSEESLDVGSPAVSRVQQHHSSDSDDDDML